MLSGIHGMIRDTSITWTSRHVKGHQDDGAEESLDNWAMLNIECDYRAKGFLQEIVNNYKHPKHKMVEGMWSVRICGMAVGTKLSSYLRKSISGAELFEYWVGEKKWITEEVIHTIDWEANGRAMKISKLSR